MLKQFNEYMQTTDHRKTFEFHQKRGLQKQ